MRNFLLATFMMVLSGCSSIRAENPAGASSPALQLAQLVIAQESPGLALKADFAQRVEFEEQYWRGELGKVLSGAELEKALEELAVFRGRMDDKSASLSADTTLIARITGFFSQNFTPEELQTLTGFMGSPEWQKYQATMRQISLAPDLLGLRTDFTVALEQERELMAARIFGESAVKGPAPAETSSAAP